MKDWKRILISENTPIREAIKVIDEGALQIALVVAEDRRLLGTITDGDVRRGILKGIALEEPAARIMNADPTVAYVQEDRDQILKRLRQKSLHQVPVLDQEGCLVGLEIIENLLRPQTRDNLIVIMAGGLGSRLAPLTQSCPKPMLKVGGKPILETVIGNFLEQGFKRFYLAVNYKAEVIQDYFGDGTHMGAEIEYLHEQKKLGTAGALSLLQEPPTEPIVVMNGDLLTKVNFQQLFDFHRHHKAMATMCVREYDFQVPYGVVKVDQHRMIGVEEKPVHKFFVNAGIYILDPQALALIPPGTHCDMPTVFERLVQEGFETTVFPIREYWLDIGRLDDFEKATGEFNEVFK